jgi:hypothetical protein
MKLMRLPAMIAAAMIGLMAGGSLTTVVSRAMDDFSAVPVHQFEEAVRRDVKPIAHTSPHFAVADAPADG